MQPYTYLLKWTQLNISYYGVRYSKSCNPNDLWVTYFTSSHHVTAFVKQHGDPDVIQIRKTFQDTAIARQWEHRVLKRLQVGWRKDYLNRTDNKSITPLYGADHPHFGKKGPDNHCYGIKRPAIAELQRIFQASLGSKHNFKQPVAMAKRAEAMKGDNHHMKRPEVATKVSGTNNWIYQKPGALEQRSKQFTEMNQARKGTHYRRVACTHCGKDYATVQIKQHKKRCKMNLSSLVANTDDIVYNKS
jgi:hypothetical protein